MCIFSLFAVNASTHLSIGRRAQFSNPVSQVRMITITLLKWARERSEAVFCNHCRVVVCLLQLAAAVLWISMRSCHLNTPLSATPPVSPSSLSAPLHLCIHLSASSPLPQAVDYALRIPDHARIIHPRRILGRVVQLAVVTTVAAAAQSRLFCFGSVIGATTASATAFLLPCAFAWKLLPGAHRGERAAWVAVGLVGVVAGICATVSALSDCSES